MVLYGVFLRANNVFFAKSLYVFVNIINIDKRAWFLMFQTAMKWK